MKQRITITLEREILDWIDSKVDDYIFANRSHSFEYLISRNMKALHGAPKEDARR